MPDFNFDTSSYPRPQPAQNPLDTILKTGQVADTLGNIEAGKAVQGALAEDGSIDQNKLATALKSTVAGSMKAIPTLDALQKLRHAGFAADQAGIDTFQKRMAVTSHLFSGLASHENPTINDVLEVAARAMDPNLDAKKYGITLPVVMNTLKSFYGPDGKPLPPAAIRKKALEIQTQAATTAEILGQHSDQVNVVQTPQGIQFQPAGTRENPRYSQTPFGMAPTTHAVDNRATLPNGQPNPNFNREVMVGQQPMPQAEPLSGGSPLDGMTGYEKGPITNPRTGKEIAPAQGGVTVGAPQFKERYDAAFTPRGPAVGQQPGYGQTVEANVQMMNNLTQAASEVPMTKALLSDLEEDLKHFSSGQGADWARVAKNFVTRNVPVPKSLKEEGAIFDEKSLASQEAFNKTAQLVMQKQFQALGGTGTDAKMASAMSTSPNEFLSRLGNIRVISLMKGLADAITAKNKEWRVWRAAGHPPGSGDEFTDWFNDHYDPRTFMFKYMDPKDRQTYLNNLPPDDQAQFLNDLTYARKKGWVNFKVK